MYPDIPDGHASWLLRHLKSKPLCLYSRNFVFDFGLPLSSEMSVPSVKFIHVSASVQCPDVAPSSSGSLAFDSRLRFCLGFSVGFSFSLVLPCMSAFSVRPTSDSVRSALFQFSVSTSALSSLGSAQPRLIDFVFKFPFIPVSVTVQKLSTSLFPQIPVHLCFGYSLKVVHVFVSARLVVLLVPSSSSKQCS
jgi:hypothetical protein